jgi:hypothetical protein
MQDKEKIKIILKENKWNHLENFNSLRKNGSHSKKEILGCDSSLPAKRWGWFCHHTWRCCSVPEIIWERRVAHIAPERPGP